MSICRVNSGIMQDSAHQNLGGFRILGELQAGAGSQGAVYRAVCESASVPGVPVGMEVALKIMSAHDDDDAQWRRILTHTQRLQQMSHPHIVRYFGCFSERDVFNEKHVVVEELLEGETLKEKLAASSSGLDVDEAVSIVDAMLSGLECAAGYGIVHRDIKPGNVFLCRNGEVKLIDFEVARVEEGDETSFTGGNIQGSFDYLSPDFLDENFRGDVRSDIFSVGVVLHEMLSGRLPYPRIEGDRRQAGFTYLARWEHANEGKNPISVNPRVKRLLSHTDGVFAKALAVRREDRYADFSEFRAGLRTIRFRELRHGESVYRLLRFIGKGGFGEVYKARHRASGKEVAVKRLLKMEYAKRFYREARIMQQLRDPCFVQFFDFFVLGDGASSEAFLVMAYLDGMPGNSLRDAIKASRGGGLPMRDVFMAFARYAHGLSVMHRRGLFHRDIKPSNLYYPQGRPAQAAIMDLGIARDENGTVTHGQVPGTLDYMPPEVVVSDSRGDGRMDIYALGLCLYEALTGELGYPRLSAGSAGLTEFFERARSGRPPNFSHPLVSHDAKLRQILVEMTNPDPSRRLGDAEEVASRLLGFCPAPSSSPSSPIPVVRASSQVVLPQMPSSLRIDALPPPQVPPSPARVHVPSFKSSSTPRVPGQEPVPVFHRSALSYVDWHRIQRRIVNGGVAAGALVLLVMVCYWAYPAIKLTVARKGLDDVCTAYRTGTWEQGEHAEREWLARWRPKGGSWLELPYPSFIDCTNRLGTAKGEAQVRIAAERKQAELDRERLDCVERLKACRKSDGRLDEDRYRALAAWELPERLKSDFEIQRIQEGLARVLTAAVRVKLELEPIVDRRARINAAKVLMENPWSRRVLDDGELKRLEKDVAEAEVCVAGVVGNLCDDPIFVEGVEIAPGGTQNLVVRDGRTAAVSVVRRGYRPIGIPDKIDGSVFQVRNTMFVALPIRAEVPSPGGGIVCVIDGMMPTNGVVDLLPGPHICVYSREDYEDQRTRFSVRVNMPVEFPGIGEWRRRPGAQTETPKRTAPDMRSEKVVSPTEATSDAEEFDPRAMLRRSVRRQCAAKLVVEPVETRQERLDEAGTILTRAVAIDHALTEDEAKTLYAAIEARRKWVVGKVVNETSDELLVGGRKVAAGQTTLLQFEEGLPEKWTVERSGFVPKTLMRDFDGVTLRFVESDFSAKNVVVRLPDLAPGVAAYLGGIQVPSAFPLKPGEYELVYRRKGCCDQSVRFVVRSGNVDGEIPPPGDWRPSEGRE